MNKRLLLFLALSLLVLVGNSWLTIWLKGKQPVPPVVAKNELPAAKKDAVKPVDGKIEGAVDPAAKPNGADPTAPAPAKAAEEKSIEPAWYTLGAIDDQVATPEKPRPRMLVTLNNRGGTIERLELNNYPDLEDQIAFEKAREDKLWNRAGYLGNLAPTKTDLGVLINVVPPGTPAQVAGLLVGDVLTSVASAEKSFQLKKPLDLFDALGLCKPETKATFGILRKGEPTTVGVILGWRPAQVIRPELDSHPLPVVVAGKHDPFSLELQLARIDAAEVDTLKTAELDNAELKNKYWQGQQLTANVVEFTRELPQRQLRIVKRFELLGLNPEKNQTGYEIRLTISLTNLGDQKRQVAYELSGPNGLPIEGWWYAYKNRISTAWFQALGIRDVALRFEGTDASLMGSIDIAKGKEQNKVFSENGAPLVYAGVDCQYFAAVLIPRRDKGQAPWLDRIAPVMVGSKPETAVMEKLANVSCALTSKGIDLEPNATVSHTYDLFVGPKKPEYLDQVGSETTKLDRLVFFGWPIFSYPAHLLLWFLHAFHALIPNYGLNIIMLTVFVRMCLFPLSRKQAISTEKMKQLQPQLAEIKEKFKGKNEEISRRSQELFRKNNFNPFGGCFLAFAQLPIFMGLYRALMIDVELRAAPLFSESIRWCSNLGAPDMLWYWEDYLPQFLSGPIGYLGPYLNVLPLITVTLFLVQQRSMMPPATDDQTRMQQSMMKYMTMFMGLMFYTVASGLCLYFIVSSLWGIMERRFLKKMAAITTTDSNTIIATAYPTNTVINGNPNRKKKPNGRK